MYISVKTSEGMIMMRGYKLKSLAALTIAAMLATCLFGCGGETQFGNSGEAKENLNKQSEPQETKKEQKAEPIEPTVVDSGFFKDEYGWISDCVVINNPNSDYLAAMPTVKATMRDSGGNVLGVETIYVDYLLPGENTIAVGSYQGEGKDVATIEYAINVSKNNWAEVDFETIRISEFEISGQSEQTGSYGDRSWVGEVTNNSGNDYEGFKAFVVLKSGGSVVTGFYAYEYDTPLSAGSTVPFEIQATIIGNSWPEYDSFEMYVYPSIR